MSAPRTTSNGDAFADLVADVAEALDASIPAWRVRLSAAATEWRALGIDATVLERAVALATAPDVDALLATFARAVAQLTALEAEAVAIDATLAGAAIFRDPTCIRDADALVAARRADIAARLTAYPDGEHWTLRWPDVGDLLAGELA